jgi:predicted outer membrane protein
MNELQGLITERLRIDSLASIELNQFAIERVTSSDVRQFAETLVTDQQHFWRALERLNESRSSGELPAPRRGRAEDNLENFENGQAALPDVEQRNPTQLGRTLPIERQIGQTPLGQTLPDQFPLSRRPPAQSLVPPADGGIRYGGTLPPAGGETRVPEGEVPNDSLPTPVPRATEPVRDTMPVRTADPASNPLVTIADRAAQSQLAITKALLLRNEGVQFDQRFVAMQLAERVRTLAQLRAVAEVGSDQFREIIETAEELTMGHLASAEALANRLDQQ